MSIVAEIQEQIDRCLAGSIPAVRLPSGIHELDRPLRLKCTHRATLLRLIGEGPARTILRASNSFIGDAIVETVGVEQGKTMLEFCEFRGLELHGLDKALDTLRLDAVANSVFEQVRMVGGRRSAIHLGYNWSNRFESCLAQNSKFGWLFSHAVNNVNTFVSCAAVANECGLYLSRGCLGFSFVGMNMEGNTRCGMYANGARGLSYSGYVEANAEQGHEITHIDGGQLSKAWHVRANFILSGTGDNSLDELPRNAAATYPCESINLTGVGGSSLEGVVDVAYAGSRNVIHQAFAVGQRGPIAEFYGQHNLNSDLIISGSRVAPRVCVPEAAQQNGDTLLADSRFSWVSTVPITRDFVNTLVAPSDWLRVELDCAGFVGRWCCVQVDWLPEAQKMDEYYLALGLQVGVLVNGQYLLASSSLEPIAPEKEYRLRGKAFRCMTEKVTVLLRAVGAGKAHARKIQLSEIGRS